MLEQATLELAAVKEFLRVDGNAEDGYLNILVLLAAELCKNFLRLDELPENESVQQAQLIIIGFFFENRDGVNNVSREGIPPAVYALLSPYRKVAF